MRFTASIMSSLIQPLDRRSFAATVARHGADAYDKTFTSWDHLIALIFAQLASASSLRALEAAWNANAHCHYHLGAGPIARSTLADANARRPTAVFAETFDMLAPRLDRRATREGRAMIELIDSTPIPLPELCAWAASNGRIFGLKMHVVYDVRADHPHRVEITPANVNDIEIGRKTALEAGATYVFDKAYCAYDWWREIHDCKAFFVTRPKANARFQILRARPLDERERDGARANQSQDGGFVVLDDHDVALASKGDSKLDMPLRLVRIARDNGKELSILSNDVASAARDIALLYKTRWQIELLFRWLKQHLKLTAFLGRSENAVRLQVLAAMIAFVLLRIAQRAHAIAMPALRFAELVGQHLFSRRLIARIDKPPDVNPSKPKPKSAPGQLELRYA